jgi:GR25 family glycosyltransferase involved in LPS biosynthesis
MCEHSPSITIGVVAHEKRRDHAEQLATLIEADVVMMDDRTQHLGCEANHRRTWHALSNSSTEWVVVLEDDAIPVPDFRHQLTQALAVAPTDIVSLYLGRSKPTYWQPQIERFTQQADHDGAHWITSPTAIHAVGLAVRTTTLQHHRHNVWLPPDQALTRWAEKNGHLISYCWPSLLEHADLPTTIRQHRDGMARTPGRVAWRTGTRDAWDDSSVHMAHPLKRKRTVNA